MDLKANYQGVYENRIGFGDRPALLLVDFVQAYFEPSCDSYAAVEGALASAIRVRDAHEAPHEANLFDMNAKYADVVSERETLAYIAASKSK